MNIYQPYEVLADTDDCLHIKESGSRESMQFTKFRILPILLLFFLWFVLQQVAAQLPMGWNYLLAAVTILVSVILLLRSYITEVKIIRGKDIFLVNKKTTGTKESTVNIADVENIILLRKKTRASFLLKMKSKKTFVLLVIPAAYFDDHHITLIKERLDDLIKPAV